MFGALQAATYVDAGRLDDHLRELLRLTALDLLDDVACLSALVATAPSWPRWRSDPLPEPGAPSNQLLTLQAVEALSTYTQRLAAVALLLAYRGDDTATLFADLAATAEARIEVLAS